MNRAFCFYFAIASLTVQAVAAERAAHYEEALALARPSGSDIVVFQRGSDWNRLGEILYQEVWLKEEFAARVGRPVRAGRGGPSGTGGCAGPAGALVREGGRRIGRPGRRLPAAAAGRSDGRCGPAAGLRDRVGRNLGGHGLQAARGRGLAGGRRESGAGDADAQDQDGRAAARCSGWISPPIRRLPGNGPGRASNGNFAVSEVEVRLGNTPVKLTAAWADAGEGAWRTVDGVSDKADQVWNAHGHLHQHRTLLVTLAEPVPAGAELTARLVCRSPWGQHVPGCLRAAVLNDPALADDVARVAGARS